ncbi:hypothetical protein K9O30_07595 [Clostridium bowmanii]|uniref:tetratricopeptide repeat protein n=1 Tax=Clostridium bowmanii TaxID=132925 RepID=UPI001C0B5BFE|nr:hypothetical protein [Clostridium bowmanii]MBU3189565.1 hypothetical protein [Clostridium bowmanii]MCA1073593.1 hypothetical protein [Clostridium bowmanii]
MANIPPKEEALIKEIIKYPLKVEEIQRPFVEESYDDVPEYNNNYSPPNVNIVNDFVDTKVNYEQDIYEFFERVNSIYNNFTYRTQEKNWIELLNYDIMWKLEFVSLINAKMIEFLMGHHFLTRNICNILNETFHWDEQERFLNDSYPETFTKYLFKQIGEERVLGYCSFNTSIKIDYEQYFHYREEAQRALLGSDLKLVKNYISLAYEMYQSDPDLLCIKGEYYLRIADKNKALEVFKTAILINPSDDNMYLYQAQIMYDSKNFTEAIKICKAFKTTD